MNLLQVENLSLDRRNRSLIKQLCLQIEAGQCWVVLGRNGSGKSSLLRTLAGIATPDSGAVLLNGDSLEQLPPRTRAKRIGLVFQHSQAGFHSTTLDMALSGGFAHHAGWGFENDKEIAQALWALHSVGLQDLAEQSLESLSGGELRRAEIARLLVQSPTLAMLDEPLNHLDLSQQVMAISLLTRQFCSHEHALMLVLHDVNLARRVASHLLLLKGDGDWLAGAADELGDAQTLGRFLGYPLRSSKTQHGEVLEVDYRNAGLP